MIKCNEIMMSLLVISHSKQALKNFLEKKETEQKSVTTFLKPQNSEYSIDQIREISREVKIAQPLKRIYVLEDFDSSSLEAQNSFLKLLEESPNNTEFILVVSHPYALLPTIISRTKIIRLDTRKNYELDTDISKTLASFLSKKNLPSLNFSFFTCSSKEDCFHILIQMCLFFRERFMNDHISPIIVKEILNVYRMLKNNNLNPQLALDHLLIFIAKKYSMK